MSFSSPEPAFHSDALDQELTEYRPVNKLALAALFLGLCSAAAIVDPLLWCVPAIGIVLAVVALVQLGPRKFR